MFSHDRFIPKRVMVYSHDAYGLGNIRRMLEIITQLARAYPDITILLITGSPMIQAFRIPSRVDYIKLPCIARSETGSPLVRYLGLPYADTVRLRADLIMMAVQNFNPDLILVDKKPLGLARELEPMLNVVHSGSRPSPRVALLLRDILDEPASTIREWQSGGYHEAIRQHYDRILVVGDPTVFDVAREYRFPAPTERKVHYCGYIARAVPSASPAQVRAGLGIGDADSLVLVTAGGGGDGSSLMTVYLQGLLTYRGPRFKSLLVTGPDMPPSSSGALQALAAQCSDVKVLEFLDEMISAMHCADLVVSMYGYNTACELLSLKKRAVVVPRVTPVQEQWIRAERLQARGLVRALHPDDLTPQRLITAVAAELFHAAPDGLSQREPKMDGLPQIGAALAELLGLNQQTVSSTSSVSSVVQVQSGTENTKRALRALP